MSYVNIEDFKNYSGIFSAEEIQQYYIDAAEDIVENYLGYNPAQFLIDSSGKLIPNTNEPATIIKLTVMRIASLLQIESDGNIGVTSKSFGDSGSRTFVNTVNFDKYLIQLSPYRKVRI